MLSSILTSLRILKRIYTGYVDSFSLSSQICFCIDYLIAIIAICQVGRSGRFGHLGLAVNLITYEDRFNLYDSFFSSLELVYQVMFLERAFS